MSHISIFFKTKLPLTHPPIKETFSLRVKRSIIMDGPLVDERHSQGRKYTSLAVRGLGSSCSATGKSQCCQCSGNSKCGANCQCRESNKACENSTPGRKERCGNSPTVARTDTTVNPVELRTEQHVPVSPHSSTVDTGSVSESQQLAWDALDQQLDGNAQVPGSTSRPALTENVVPLPSAIGRSTSSLVLAYLDQRQGGGGGGLPGTQSPDSPQPGSPATFDLPNLSESQYTSELNIFTDLPPKLGRSSGS